MKKHIAIITKNTTDFRSFVIEIYKKLEGNKSRIGGSNRIEIEHDDMTTVYHQITDFDDVVGIEFDSYETISTIGIKGGVLDQVKLRTRA